MLRHPFTIGGVYEKVARTSNGEISRQFKTTSRLPSPVQQWQSLHAQRQRGLAAEQILQDVTSLVRSYQPTSEEVDKIERIVTGQVSDIAEQISTSDIAILQGSEQLLREIHSGESTFNGMVLDLSQVTDELKQKAKSYGASLYVKSAKQQKEAYNRAAEQLADEVIQSVLSGHNRTQKRVLRIKAERVVPAKPLVPVQELKQGKVSKFIEHYQQLNSTTPLLDDLYGRALTADELRRIRTQSPFATHMMTQQGICGLWLARMEKGGI